MNSTPVIVGFDPADLELLKQHGLTDDQVGQVALVCKQMGVSIATILPLLQPAIIQAARSIEEVPDLGQIYARIDGLPTSREEHRLHSMRKPTGKPWSKRGRR